MLPNNSTQGLMGLIDAASVLNRPSQMVGPQQAEEGLAGLIKGSPQAPAALSGLSQDAVPNGGDMQSVMSILGQNQGATPVSAPSGGGMFDAYSPQNQTNMQMAMIADMIGNFAGRDVGAMKTMMPYVENSRKLRLQGEENAAYDKMVSRLTPQQQKFLKALPISMRPMAMKQFLELQFAVKGREGPLVSVGMGDKIGVKAFENMSDFMKSSGVKKEAAYNNLRESEVVLSLLRERNPETGEYVMTTGPGQEGWTRAQAFFVNALESFGTKGMQEHFSGLESIVGRKQFFDSVSKSKTLLKAALMKGNLSEKELDFSTDTVAHLLRGRYSNILTAELAKIAEETEYNRAVHLDKWYSANLAKYEGNLAGMDAALRNEVNSWNAADRKKKVGHMTDLIARLDVESRAAENFVVTPTAGADSNSWQTEMTMDQLRDRAAKSRPSAQ